MSGGIWKRIRIWGLYSSWSGAACSNLHHQSAWIQGCFQQLLLNVTENICVSFSAVSLTLSLLRPGLMFANRARWELILNKTQVWSKWPPRFMGKQVSASISRCKGYRGEFLSIVSCCLCALVLRWSVYQPFGLWNQTCTWKVLYVRTDPNNSNVKSADV